MCLSALTNVKCYFGDSQILRQVFSKVFLGSWDGFFGVLGWFFGVMGWFIWGLGIGFSSLYLDLQYFLLNTEGNYETRLQDRKCNCKEMQK